MIFNIKKHNTDLYNTLLYLSRNFYFYNKINLKDTFETRIYLMFIHFSLILIIFKKKKINFSQFNYDNLFYCIENNLRELGFGDIAVNKKMKDLNKILYDILLKLPQETMILSGHDYGEIKFDTIGANIKKSAFFSCKNFEQFLLVMNNYEKSRKK